MGSRDDGGDEGVSRRAVLRGVAVGSGMLAAVPVLAKAVSHGPEVAVDDTSYDGTHRPAGPAAGLDADVAAFLGELGPGARVDRWTIAGTRGAHFGAIVVVMHGDDGIRFQVDVLRRGDGAQPIARTPSLDVFVSNRGDGSTQTIEEHGLAAMALAGALAAREATGTPLPALLTHAERRAAHPLGTYRVDV